MSNINIRNRNTNAISVDTDKGTIIAYTYQNEDGYAGIRTEFIKTNSETENRPMVALEFNPDGELQGTIYTSESEDPVYTTDL